MASTGWSFTPPTTLKDVPQASYGDHPAVIVPEGEGNSPGFTVSYAGLAREVESVARQLQSLLVRVETPETKKKAEKVVALAMINNLEFAVGFLAIPWAGAATAPLNPSYKVDEFAFYLEDNGVDILLISPEGNEAAVQAAGGLKIPVYQVQYNSSTQTTTLVKVSGPGPTSWETSQQALPVPAPEDSVMYMHTSGTTSRPKRVQLTHRNLASSLRNIQKTYELSPSDRTLLVMPLFHVHGLIAGMLTTFASGGTVIMHGRFAASKFWLQVVAHGATWYTAVPTIHQILLIRAETDYPKDNPPPLRFIRSCSASLAASVLERLESSFHAPVLEAYAMTENAHQMTSNPLPKYGVRKPGSVGKATGIELAVLDDNCQLLPPGAEGEVCIRGPSVTPGYVGNPKANEEGFKGGWFHTGDQGKLDEEGYLTLTGRIKELINRGGEKISPLEIDAVLLSHPKVAEAVSFAAPDPKYGEEVNAVVTVKPGQTLTEAELLQHARSQLADFKLPKKLYIAADVPRTATGKIQRRIVAEHFLKVT